MHEQQPSDARLRSRIADRPWLKAAYTVYAGAAIAAQTAYPEPAPLWFSDVALLGSVLALWFEQRLLASMMALAVLVPETAWNIGFFARLLVGVDPFGLASPVFESDVPLPRRAAALSHLVTPALLGWLVYRLGYDARALAAQTLLGWAVLVLGLGLAPAALSGTLGLGGQLAQAWLPAWLWLLVVMLAYPLLVYLPGHLVLGALFGPGEHRWARRLAGLVRRRRRLAPGTRERWSAPGHALQARLRDLADFAFVRRRR